MKAELLAAQLPSGRIDDHEPDYAPARPTVIPVLVESVTVSVYLGEVVLTKTGHIGSHWASATYGFAEAA